MNYLLQGNEQIISRITEPEALHTHVLSTVKLEQPITSDKVKEFFSTTYGYSHLGAAIVNNLVDKSLNLLTEMQLTYHNNGVCNTTLMGNKICELYIDPLSYPKILVALGEPFSVNHWLETICSLYDFEARSNIEWPVVLGRWINETPKDRLIVGGGDLNLAVELSTWLIYSSQVIASLRNFRDKANQLEELSIRMKYGIRSELIPLCKIKWVGREISRALFNIGITDAKSLKENISRSSVKHACGRFYNRIADEL